MMVGYVFGGLHKMNQACRNRIKELPPGAFIEIPGYLSTIRKELREIEHETGSRYKTRTVCHGAEIFVRVTNTLSLPCSLRTQVLEILSHITEDNPVQIPAGKQAAYFVREHSKKVGRKFSIRKNTVYLVPKISIPPGTYTNT